jgi:tetratricopeptide (TPR) repeat protein
MKFLFGFILAYSLLFSTQPCIAQEIDELISPLELLIEDICEDHTPDVFMAISEQITSLCFYFPLSDKRVEKVIEKCANTLSEYGHYQEAQRHYNRLLRDFKNRYGKIHIRTGLMYFQVGNCHYYLRNLASASRTIHLANAIQSVCQESYPEDIQKQLKQHIIQLDALVYGAEENNRQKMQNFMMRGANALIQKEKEIQLLQQQAANYKAGKSTKTTKKKKK